MIHVFILGVFVSTVVSGYPFFQQSGPFIGPPEGYYPQVPTPQLIPNQNSFGGNQSPAINPWAASPHEPPMFGTRPEGRGFGTPGQSPRPEYSNPKQSEFDRDVQKCLEKEGPEYYAAFMSIALNPKLTKSEVVERGGRLMKRLNDSTQSCYEAAKSTEKKRLAEKSGEQKKILSRLSSEAGDLFKQIEKVQNDDKLTSAEEWTQLRDLLQKANPRVATELTTQMPELRKYLVIYAPQPTYQQPYGGDQMFG